VASEFVAPPTERPPHSTGGAVDITLLNRNGRLDLGCPINWSGPESRTNAAVGVAAERARSVLVDACASAGLVNYPYEWWHWSYGDPYWAVVTGHAAAVYDAIDA
jgi:D-alanyl-D-alanine dipeptidase